MDANRLSQPRELAQTLVLPALAAQTSVVPSVLLDSVARVQDTAETQLIIVGRDVKPATAAIVRIQQGRATVEALETSCADQTMAILFALTGNAAASQDIAAPRRTIVPIQTIAISTMVFATRALLQTAHPLSMFLDRS